MDDVAASHAARRRRRCVQSHLSLAGRIADAGRDAFLVGFHTAALIGALVMATAAVLVFRLLPALRRDPLVSEVASAPEPPDAPDVDQPAVMKPVS